MKYRNACLVTFLICFLSACTAPLFAFGSLSATEVRTLFSGKTVEGEHREGTTKHIDPAGVSMFPERFLCIFQGTGA